VRQIYYAALGDHGGFCDVARSPGWPGNTRVFKGVVCPMRRLDGLGLIDCDAIVLDVEGFEYRIILRALETIRESWPAICVETAYPGLHRVLTEMGYRLAARPADNYLFVRTAEELTRLLSRD
jgi:hypothetical protein